MTPTDESQLAQAVAQANGPLCIQGGGTRAVCGPQTGSILSVSQMSGISLYEPGALTIVAQAGTPLAKIKSALESKGQRLAFEPIDHRGLMHTTGEPTIGGVVAANVSGPRRIQAGACRDFLLGVRFVDGQGQIIKNGGRVMKNVTGYDLVKLMAGSFGTLGVLSEVSLKVLPKPETMAGLSIQGLPDQDAVRALSTALGSPYEVTGAAHAPIGPGGNPITMIRLEGFENSVRYRAAKLSTLLQKYGDVDVETDSQNCATSWDWVRDVGAFHKAEGDVWRLSVKPSDGPAIAARLDAKALIYDWGGGLIWALVDEGTDVRKRLKKFKGHATLVRANTETFKRFAKFQPEPVPIAAITAGLRNKFDPRGILNPGLMG